MRVDYFLPFGCSPRVLTTCCKASATCLPEAD
jgi:hypothetical protein